MLRLLRIAGEPDDLALSRPAGAPAVTEGHDPAEAAALLEQPRHVGTVVGDGDREVPSGPAEFEDTGVVVTDVPLDVGQQLFHSTAHGPDVEFETPVAEVCGDDPSQLGHTLCRYLEFDQIVPVEWNGHRRGSSHRGPHASPR